MQQKIEMVWNKKAMSFEEFLKRVQAAELPFESASVVGAIEVEKATSDVRVYHFT